MSKAQTLRTNVARALGTTKNLGIRLIKSSLVVGLAMIVTVNGGLTAQQMTDAFKAGLDIPADDWVAYTLFGLLVLTFQPIKGRVVNATLDNKGSNLWLVYGMTITGFVAIAALLLGDNPVAWAFLFAGAWAAINIRQAWMASITMDELMIEASSKTTRPEVDDVGPQVPDDNEVGVASNPNLADVVSRVLANTTSPVDQQPVIVEDEQTTEGEFTTDEAVAAGNVPDEAGEPGDIVDAVIIEDTGSGRDGGDAMSFDELFDSIASGQGG